MMALKVFQYIFNTKKWGIIYERFIVYGVPALIGRLSLVMYGIIFPNLYIGSNIGCWGSVIISKPREALYVLGTALTWCPIQSGLGSLFFPR